MSDLKAFLNTVRSEFEPDRLTFQHAIPTFHPESTDEAARLFKMAGKDKIKVFITGFGNNIIPEGDAFKGMLAIKSDRLNQLHEISAKDLYVRVGSGYPLKELNVHLAKENLMLPHANLPYVGSVGGALAIGLSAELHGHDFPLKRYFLKGEIVTAEGEIVEPGSVCFKSVSGYDIVKIFARSWGLLGFIASATLRVMPDTAAPDYAAARMKDIDRKSFLAGLAESNNSADAIYSRKIKDKFDPHGILPVVQ